MERNRDGRRGVAGGGPVPARRRPRTSGHKDSSVGDEDDMLEDGHNVKAREKPKVDNCGVASMQGMLGSSMLGSRNKRKKNGLQEPRNSTPDEVEEMTEDTDAGASEDDDDQPPPIARKPIKVRKSHEETIPVDLLAVPRKARTSMQKRCQESPPPPVSDTVQHSPVPSSTPSSAIKGGKRLKSSGVKSRPMKLPKATIPSSISEQEVEVAEALLKMVTNHSFADFKMEAKSEFKFDQKLSGERTGGGNSSTIPASSQANATAPLSPHGTTVPPMAEAPKRKRPRVRSRPEEGSRLPSFLSSSIGGTMSGDADHLQLSTGLGNDTLAAKGEAEDADQPLPSNRYPPTMPSDMPTSDFHVSTINTMGVPVTSSSLTLEAGGDRSNTPAAAECNIESLDRSKTSSCKVESEMATKSFTCTESLVKLELGKRSPEVVDNNRPPKFEIDLMASPIPDEKLMDSMEVAGKDVQDKRVVANTSPIFDLEDHKQIQVGKELENDLKQTGMKQAHGNALKDQERDQAAKQILEKNLEGVKSETRAAQKLERSVAATVASAAASFLASVSTAPSCTFSSSTSSDVVNPPSANMWPGLLSPFAYFSAAAAAAAGWPASFATDPNNSAQIQLPSSYPAIHSQSRWKRCAFHVHIAHYIEIQQQLARHPFVYANPASLFGAKSYNINAPLDGNSANVTSGGLFAGGSTMTSAAATGTSERDANAGTGQQAKDRTPVESSGKQSNNQQPSVALQAGVPLSFAVTQGASSTHPTNLLSGNSGLGASVSNSGDTKVLITAPGTANAVVDMTPAQAQYLQAVMQQNSFAPFSFPFANIPQQHGITQQQLNMQAAQFVGSPYYNARLVHSSQAHLSTQKQPGSRAEKDSNATGENLTSDGANSSSQAVEFAMLGAKQASKSHQLQASSNSQVQQQSVSLPPPLQQLATGTSSLHIKGLESQTSPAFPAMSVSTIAKGSVGRGPLGLAPVAAIMAPQGHAMLQNVPDAVRGNSHGQQHHPFSQSGQFYQQLHPAQGQKTSGVTDDNRVTAESIIYGTASTSNGGGNSKGRDSPEGKVTMKRPQGTSTSTRVDIEAGANFQGSPTRSSSSRVQASRVMTSGSSLNQSLSQAMRQSGHGLPGNGPSLTKQSARPNLINKFLTNQSAMPASQALRQADASAQVQPSQVQIRPAQRPLPPQNMSLGNSAQAVLGPAAMMKNQSQQARNQQVAANARSSTSSASHLSGTIPLPPLSKPVITPVSKGAAGNKVTYSPSQKLQSNNAGKRSSPTSSPNAHVSSSNTAAQALPLKPIFPPMMRPTQQQGQYPMQSLMQSTQQQQLASSHSSSQHQYQQQVVQQQKQQHTQMQYRQQFLMQQQYFQQQTSQSPQQSIVYQSSQSETHPYGLQQHVLAHSNQQQQQHPQQSHEHQTSLPSSAVLGGGNSPMASSLSLGPNISASNSPQAVTSEGVMSGAKPNVSSNTKVGSGLQMRAPQKSQPGTMTMLPQFGSPNPETTASNFMQQGPKLLPVVRPLEQKINSDGTIQDSNGAGTNARLSTNITSFSHPQSPLRSQSGGNGSGKSSQISPNNSTNTNPPKISTANIASPVSTSQANPGGQLQTACSQQLAAAPVVAGPVASPVITGISGGSTGGNGK